MGVLLERLALRASNVLVLTNTFSHLYPTTHLITNSFAGIGVLDLLHNTSVAHSRGAPPSTAVKVATGLRVHGRGEQLGAWRCLVYDLVAVAVAVGQSGGWRALWEGEEGSMGVGSEV